MAKALLLLSLFALVSCGREVSISNRKLQENSQLSDGSAITPNMSGTIKRGTPDLISANGMTYKVSMYSSYAALEFIAAKPLNSQFQVRFKGKIVNGEMVIEVIQ